MIKVAVSLTAKLGRLLWSWFGTNTGWTLEKERRTQRANNTISGAVDARFK